MKHADCNVHIDGLAENSKINNDYTLPIDWSE